jgi:hypothetical protein
MVSRKTLGLILSGVLILTGVSCPKGYSEHKSSKPKIEQIEQIADFTGDGIKDYIVNTKIFCGDLFGERILFVGQKNGSYIRAREKVDNNGITYFLTDDKKTAYFFDGKHFKESQKQK